MLDRESLAEVEYRVQGESLYRYQADLKDKIVPWGAEFGAWRLKAGCWQPFTPEINVAALEQAVQYQGASRLPSWRRRVGACRFLIDRWPPDVRELIRPFSSANWQLLAFLNAGGARAHELVHSNPALGYLAALAGVPEKASLRRRKLAAFLGFPETEHAVNLLQKVMAPWISPGLLVELRNVITREREADALLKHLPRINAIALEVARDPELRAAVAPQCVARLGRMPAPIAQCDLIARMRELVKTYHNETNRGTLIRSISDLDRLPARPPAADRRMPLMAPARSQDPSAFPEPPLPDRLISGIRIEAIRTRLDLIAESDIMHHCAGRDPSYARRVLERRLYFYRMLEPERLTIAIRPAGAGWEMDEIRGAFNRTPADSSRMVIKRWILESLALPAAKPAVPPAPVLTPRGGPVRCAGSVAAHQLSFDF